MALPALRDLARTVADSVRTPASGKVTARPYNQFSDDDWYIIPGTDWPAYSLPKLVVWRQESRLLCAFYVEKGMEGVAQSMFGSPPENFDSGWAWNRALTLIENRELTSLVLRSAQEEGFEPIVRLDCATVRDASTEPRDMRSGTNEWRLEANALAAQTTVGGDPCAGQLGPVDDVDALLRRLREPPGERGCGSTFSLARMSTPTRTSPGA